MFTNITTQIWEDSIPTDLQDILTGHWLDLPVGYPWKTYDFLIEMIQNEYRNVCNVTDNI